MQSSCETFELTGLTTPVRIAVYACDARAEPTAAALVGELRRRIKVPGATASNCGGPTLQDLGQRCMGWGEPSCRHIFVPLIGAASVPPDAESIAREWLKRRGSLVIPAICPPLDWGAVFFRGHSLPRLARCTASSWNGRVRSLADAVQQAALLDEHPGIFLSYLRKESSAAAEHLHDELVRAGFRVFLDRFTGSTGRVFPHELAEAMTDMGLVVLLETPGLMSSRWTLWEAAFARRYCLGPLALNFQGAPHFANVAGREMAAPTVDPTKPLPGPFLQTALNFIRREYPKIATARRAYYEALVHLAAQSKGGQVDYGSGVLEVRDKLNHLQGAVLPQARPGKLRDVHALMLTRSPVHILGGDHQHLAPKDRDAMHWLATKAPATLAGAASIYRVVRSIL